ncbi:CoA pyrophosphatase [Iodobacter fluviatilis]|uniref:8-oxo-dGTP pyrophosphatase MutT (NUDIX family) n=1 Tax=Iodobacter fluviatilis TaxID=537 RepID=A0A377Q5I0_9NEIS|nr:CoA pyrophosphatase [Iodobacter fluviatilis]TCU89136.1 8-oxo-dGTP pyrophosphatase MutT (NUDIX family) [Iodobacter fluviatilis]STQ90504.1 putative NUDIX hydrolase [Iodobacter fluviatilis]
MILPSSGLMIPWLQSKLDAATHITAGDLGGEVMPESRKAAVLIPLVLHPDGPTVLFTERAAHLSTHAGQVSFPGGAYETQDADLIATALRETQEEIGLSPERVAVMGSLAEYFTISRFRVTPVVGVLQPGFDLMPDPDEVADVFELPLSVLLDTRRFERRMIERNGQRGFTHFLEHDGRVVWGATAGMLLMLARSLE